MTIRLASIFILTALLAGPALARDCERPREAGRWVHPDPKPKMLSSLEIEHFCVPDRRFGEWKIRAKSRCSPRDCTWGWSPGQRKTRSSLYTGFQGFFSTRFVTMRVFGERLEAHVEVDFSDPDRPDQSYTVVLHRD